jgi:hypothetical protein
MNAETCLVLKWFLNQVLRSAAPIYILNSFPSIGQQSLQTLIDINPYIHYSIQHNTLKYSSFQ